MRFKRDLDMYLDSNGLQIKKGDTLTSTWCGVKKPNVKVKEVEGELYIKSEGCFISLERALRIGRFVLTKL